MNNSQERAVGTGTLDPSFGENGVVDIKEENILPYSILALNGKLIYASGDRSDSFKSMKLRRMDASGKFEDTFGNNGSTVLPIGWSMAPRFGLFPYQGDKFLVKGTYLDSWGQRDMVLARLDVDGQLDTTFGSDGYVRIDPYTLPIAGKTPAVVAAKHRNSIKNLTSAYDYIGGSVCVQPDGKILVAHSGIFAFGNPRDWWRGLVIRLMPDGTFDKSFNETGFLLLNLENFNYSDNEIISIALQKDGKFLVFGSCFMDHSSTANLNGFIIRYKEDGQVDSDFNHGRPVIVANPEFRSISAGAVSVRESNGAIVVVGFAYEGDEFFSPQTSWIAVLKTNGSPNLEFNAGKPLFSNILLEGGLWRNCAWQEGSNAIIVTGSVAARYLPDGSLDPSFNGKGWFFHKSLYRHMTLTEDRKLVLMGTDGYPFVLRSLI